MTDKLTAEDRLDIQQLVAEYSHYEDNGDAQAWAALYTTDGRFIGSGDKVIVGKVALAEFAAKRWADKPQVRKWTHWIDNLVIWPTAEGAEAKCYQSVIETKDGANRIVKISGKHDLFRREGGAWKFYERRVTTLPAE